MRSRLLFGLGLLALPLVPSAPALAQDDFGVVPLVNENAPKLVVWFRAAPTVSTQDARAVETQVLKDFDKRRDFRLVASEKVLAEIKAASKPELLRCEGGDACLLAIGRLLKADRVIGADLQPGLGGYRLLFKAIDLKRQPPAKLFSVVEGSVSDLLMGGLSSGVAATFDKDVEALPITEEGEEAPPPIKLATRPEPAAKPELKPEPEPKPEPKPEPEPEAGPRVAGAGNVKVETLEGTPAGGEVVVAAPARPGFFERHLGSVICFGIGLVAGGAGLGLGVSSMNAQDSVEQQWDPDTDASGRDQALAANVLFGVAGAAAITAVILFIIEPGADDAPAVEVAPGGAAIRW